MATFLEKLDNHIEDAIRSWNIYTTLLVILLVIFLIYPAFTSLEPDTHPLLLTRQATVSPVRYEGESAVYRSLETPYGYPLRSGLNVKDPGAARWAAGRDGDLRDVWRQIVNPQAEDGKPRETTATISTVHGKEDVEKHDLNDLTKQINAIGTFIKSKRAETVAISLSNSVESLIALFAASFYGFATVLIPPAQSESVATALINMSNADFLITEAGSLPLESIKKGCRNIKEVIHVVEKTSRQLSWDEVGSSAWHELVENSSATSDILPVDQTTAAKITTIWQDDRATTGEIVSFTQSNIVAAIAAQLSALPARQRVSDADLFMPADALSTPYILIQTLAALYAGASVTLNSVAGRTADLKLVAASVSPTMIACSADSALKLHRDMSAQVAASGAKRLALRSQRSSLEAGTMPTTAGLGKSLLPPAAATLGKVAGKLRLLYVFERVHAGTPPVSPSELSDLRAFTGARVIYALTAAKVAGVVAQSGYFDYRVVNANSGKHSHFGTPVSSVEIKVVDSGDHKSLEGQSPKGNIVVIGPAVLGGKAELNIAGTFRPDGTLAYL